MKIIGVIGDIHGRVIWKEIVKNTKVTNWIFIGDYFDAYHQGVSGNKQIVNFKEILELKKANPDKITLLLGNHDYHYIRGIGESYSGYQATYALEIGELVEQAIKDNLIQMCYLYDNFFFSHAGLTKTWVRNIFSPNNVNPLVTDILVHHLNDYLYYQPRIFRFMSGDNASKTGDDVTQGPIWVRPESLLKDMVDGITCVVGHTSVSSVTIYEKLILVDCLGRSDEYLIIEDGLAKSSKINLET